MVQTRKIYLVVPVVGVLIKTIAAQNITASTCVSPDGFNACYDQVYGMFTDCTATYAGDIDGMAACACGLTRDQAFCALENCWNVVYGCEYQRLAATLVTTCFANIQDVPCFPSPENAPGGCSCNLGYIVGNVTNSFTVGQTCVSQTTGLDVGRDLGCNCCSSSGALTSVFDICPDVSPEYIGFPAIDTEIANQESGLENCASAFDQYNCVNDLGFDPIGTISYLSTVPSSTGTLSPSTTGGTVTTPPYGSSIVYSFSTDTTTITPVIMTSAIGSNSAEGGSQAPGSSATDSNSPTTTSNALRCLSIHSGLPAFALLVVYLAIFGNGW